MFGNYVFIDAVSISIGLFSSFFGLRGDSFLSLSCPAESEDNLFENYQEMEVKFDSFKYNQ